MPVTYNGKNFVISIRNTEGVYYPIACDTNTTIAITRSNMDITGPGDGKFVRRLPKSDISATASGDGLVAFDRHISLVELQQFILAGQRLLIQVELTPLNGSVLYEFEGYLTNVEMAGPATGEMTYTYNIESSGPIAITAELTKDPTEIGDYNILLVSPGGAPFEIDQQESNLII